MATNGHRRQEVKITRLAKLRIHLRLMNLLLILGACVALYLGERAVVNHLSLLKENAELRKEKADTEVYLKENKGKIDALLGIMKRQSSDVKYLRAINEKRKNTLFTVALSNRIYQHIREEDPGKDIYKISPQEIQTYLEACMDLEKAYEIRYKKYKGKYSWKTMAKMLYIEHKFEKDPKRGAADEMGAPQIREFYSKDGKKIPYLYQLMCKLGYKRGSYDSTILLYRDSPYIQVECMYEHFTRKLKEQEGDFVKAVVAYNFAKKFPEQSSYWFMYQKTTLLFNRWIREAEKEVKK